MKPRVSILPFLALALTCAAHGETYTWTNTGGGNWNTASNWNTNPDVPVFGADVVVDFSTLNLTGSNKTLNLGSTGKAVGKIKFGDTTASHGWDIIAQNGPLMLQTTTGQPEIEVINWRSDITVQLAGTQGFNKTGSNVLRLNNNANPVTGEILVSAGSLQVRDGTTNNPTVFAAATMDDRSLRSTGTGIIDLFRIGASGTQNVTWSLPVTTLESGGTLRFRTDNAATYNHSMAANLSVGSGGGTVQNNGGTGVQSITLGGTLSGSGALSYSVGAGSIRQLTISSADNSFSGNWEVSHAGTGTAILRAGAANALGTGSVTLNANGNLLSGADGSLNSLSGVTLQHAGSSLDLANQSWSNPAASLTVNNGTVQVGNGLLSIGTLSMSGGEMLLAAAAGGSAPVVTAGNADFGGRNLVVALSGSPVGNPFELVRYSGALSNPPVVVLGGDSGRLISAVNNGSGTNDRITLTFTGSVADLVWTGANSNVWDNNTTANFLNGASPDVFRSFDNVTFNDSSAVKTVTLPGSLNAGTVTFDHGTAAYTLDGAGAIAGPASLVKSGNGTLTVNTPNTFFGPVSVNGGKLVLGNAAALGATAAKTLTIGAGAQLDFNGFAPGAARAYTYKLQGAGDGSGALVNSQTTGINENSGVLYLELLGNTTIGGSGRFDIGRAGTATGSILGNGHTLTKAGTNSIFLRAPAQNLSILATQGTLGVQDSALALGGATGSVNVSGGASLLVQDGLNLATPLRLQDSAVLTTAGTGSTEWSGPVTLAGTAIINLPSAPLTISGAITEDGGASTLRKEGANVLTLSGSNNHSGGTLIVGGQVTATSDSAFGTGTVTAERDDTGAGTLRINLLDVELDNDIVLNSNAPTVGRAMLSTAAGNTLSVLNGDITLARFPSSGGTFSAFDGGILRVLGAIWSTNGINPNARSGMIEIGGGQGNYTVFAHGEGTLRLLSDNAIVPTARVLSSINGSCTLDMNGFDQTLAGLGRQTENSSLVTNSSAEPVVLTVNSTTDTAFGGTIEDGVGGVSIVKTGPETWTISGSNTYTGTTTVTAGTLAIDGSQASAVGAISVSGATSTLTGSGSVGGDITVAGGATFTPGGPAAGTFNSGSDSPIQMQSGTRFGVRLDSEGASSSKLYLNGNLTLASGVKLEAIDVATTPAALPVGTELVIIDYGPYLFQGTFDGLPEGAPLTIGVNGFTIQYKNNDRVTLTATGVEDPYLAWAADPSFGLIAGVNNGFAQDADNDGLTNGLEWILGGNPSQQDASSLVSATRLSAGALTPRLHAANRRPSPSPTSPSNMTADLARRPGTQSPSFADSGPDANGVIVDINNSQPAPGHRDHSRHQRTSGLVHPPRRLTEVIEVHHPNPIPKIDMKYRAFLTASACLCPCPQRKRSNHRHLDQRQRRQLGRRRQLGWHGSHLGSRPDRRFLNPQHHRQPESQPEPPAKPSGKSSSVTPIRLTSGTSSPVRDHSRFRPRPASRRSKWSTTSVITVGLDGTQGLKKRVPALLRLNNTANPSRARSW
jgi:autotransporter-associated beta strand protein